MLYWKYSMKLGIIIYSNDAETIWNVFRLANSALKHGDAVKIFLLAKGVESEFLDTEQFKVADQIKLFIKNGGILLACGTCLKIRKSKGSELCPASTMEDLYGLVRESDKILTF